MADVFNSRAGFVAVITDPGAPILPGKVAIGGFKPQAALISGVDYQQSTCQQFQPSMDGAVYIYVFGDNMGDVCVNGVAFPQLCGGGSEGLLEVFKFYEQNRASKSPKPVTVQLGSKSIQGFLTALKTKNVSLADDPASFMANYSMVINTLPEK